MKENENTGKMLVKLSSKLGVRIRQRYAVRSYDSERDTATSAKFQLIFKRGLFIGEKIIFASNSLGDTSDGIQDVQDYLSYLSKYKSRLSVVAKKIDLNSCFWTLTHEFYYEFEGDEIGGMDIAKSLNLNPKDEHRLAELFTQQAEKESGLVGWFTPMPKNEAEEYAKIITDVAHRPLNLSDKQLGRLRQAVAAATTAAISEQDDKR